MHHPVFGVHGGKQDSPKRRATLQPAFDRNGIDLVLQGMTHTYSRTGRMRHAHGDGVGHTHEETAETNVPIGLRARDDQTGTVVVSVGGPKMLGLVKQPFMVKATENTQLYQVVSIDGDELTYSACRRPVSCSIALSCGATIRRAERADREAAVAIEHVAGSGAVRMQS